MQIFFRFSESNKKYSTDNPCSSYRFRDIRPEYFEAREAFHLIFDDLAGLIETSWSWWLEGFSLRRVEAKSESGLW